MTRIVLIVLAALALAVPAASAAPAREAGTPTIAGIAASSPQFSTLLSLVKKAGLADELSAPGALTVFAPTNAAFAKVPKATLDALAKDKEKLKAVLLYHVVRGRVPASKVVKLTSAKTVNGASVRISVRRDKVYLNGSTRVTKTNVRASNGIIHVINRVLLPPPRPAGRCSRAGLRRGSGRRSARVVLVLERGPEPADRLAEPPPGLREPLRPEDDQRDHEDDDEVRRLEETFDHRPDASSGR